MRKNLLLSKYDFQGQHQSIVLNFQHYQETIDHWVSGCQELVKTEYIKRYSKGAAYLSWKVCKQFNLKLQDKYYEH